MQATANFSMVSFTICAVIEFLEISETLHFLGPSVFEKRLKYEY